MQNTRIFKMTNDYRYTIEKKTPVCRHGDLTWRLKFHVALDIKKDTTRMTPSTSVFDFNTRLHIHKKTYTLWKEETKTC